MKRLLLLMLLGFSLISNAETPENVRIVQGTYTIAISPNGEWLAGQGGNPSVYNVKTGELCRFDMGYLGLGNTIADNGMAVGDANDQGVLFYNNEIRTSEVLSQYKYCNLNAITPDGSRLAGMVSNPNGDGVMYVPFYADLDSEGKVTGSAVLPYPDRDLFGSIPQYITAVWISNDGKTIAGQVIDSKGEYIYPILYTFDENNEWSYILPSASLFNPTGVQMVKDPYLSEPPYPYPENFMTALQAAKYKEDYEAWVAAGARESDKPYEEDYMSKEKYEQYQEAVAIYNDWYERVAEEMAAFNKMYDEILKTSPTYSPNEMALHPDGSYMVMRGGKINKENEIEPYLYEFDTKGVKRIIKLEYENQAPCQILADGTIVTAITLMTDGNSYLLLPGKDEYISVQDFISTVYPATADWMTSCLTGGSGVVKFSNDMSVMAGAVVKDMFSEEVQENITYKYNTYLISGLLGLEEASIEELKRESTERVCRVYNIQGIKLMETKDASELKSLPKGIYIIDGNKFLNK